MALKRRSYSLLIFLLLLAWAATLASNNPVPDGEHTFEVSRQGFQAVSHPGPYARNDFVRMLLRRQGDFRMPLTVNFRDWRMAEEPDLWQLDLPHVVKVELTPSAIRIVHKPDRLRLGVSEAFSLPVIFRWDGAEPVDVDSTAVIAGVGPGDRFTLNKGLTYASLVLRPASLGSHALKLRFASGIETRRAVEATILVETVDWGWLELETLEAGSPLPARVYVYGSDGLAYAPNDGSTLGRITWTAGDYFFYSAGRHRIRLPVGQASIEVARGIEYEARRRVVEIAAGHTASVAIEIERFEDRGAAGWWSGDDHIHANYNDHEPITPSDVKLQVTAEDLNVAHLMVANSSGAKIHDRQYFEGRPHALSGPRSILYWTEEMRNAGLYGHMCLSGITSLVEPLYTGFADSPWPYDYPPNHAQAVAAKNQGGVATYTHPGYRFTDDPQTVSARELPIDAALGSIEAMDVVSNSNETSGTAYWYRLLNSGLKIAISAGTDSFTNRRHHWVPGANRVYAYTGAPLEYGQWLEAYRRGRSFATNGPLIDFTVDGELPGAEIEVRPGRRVQVKARARSIIPMERLEIVINGEVIASTAPAKAARELTLDKEVALDGPAWIAARASGGFDRLLLNDSALYGHTSPVYLLAGGKRYSNPADGAFFVAWIDKMISAVNQRGKFANDEQRREVVELFREGQQYYREIAAQ